MKYLLIIFLSFAVFAQDKAPSIWGQIIKAPKTTVGYDYFIYFKKDGQAYAYPLSHSSEMSLKKIKSLVGQFAKIEGEPYFEKKPIGESEYIMTFKVTNADPLKLSELNENFNLYEERQNLEHYKSLRQKPTSEEPTVKGISDKVANTAIFVGGAALALEVLSNIVKK